MKELRAYWYTVLGTAKVIGIVKVDTGYEDKYYIGIADGEDENRDIQQILDYGSRFYPGIFAEKRWTIAKMEIVEVKNENWWISKKTRKNRKET